MLERNLALEESPSPQALWARYCAWKAWTDAVRQVAEFDYAPAKMPRYYRLNAINRTVAAIADGQQRALLVIATGTGKLCACPIPPLAEQARILARVEQVRGLCSDLLQRLVAGQPTPGHLADSLVEDAATA